MMWCVVGVDYYCVSQGALHQVGHKGTAHGGYADYLSVKDGNPYVVDAFQEIPKGGSW